MDGKAQALNNSVEPLSLWEVPDKSVGVCLTSLPHGEMRQYSCELASGCVRCERHAKRRKTTT